MLSIHDATQIGPLLQALILEWAQELFPDKTPEILVASEAEAQSLYTLGPLITLSVSGEYERSYAFGDYRVYMGPLTEAVDKCACGYLLPEAERRGHVICDGLLWTLNGRSLRIARLDESSLAAADRTVLNIEARRMVLTELFREPFIRLFTLCREQPSETETIAAFEKFHAQISAQALIRTGADIEANLERLGELNRQLQDTHKALLHQREQLRLLKQACNDKCLKTGAVVERIGRQLHRLVGGRIQSISISSTELSVLHKYVSIESASGETSELGDIRLHLNLADDKELIRFERVCDNEDRSGYFHPHIATNGSPCLGNIGEDVAKLLEQREWGTLILLLDQFLNSYNDQNPYIAWFEEESEDDEHESCYENGDYSCSRCNDSSCPYWDGRWRRCHDDSTTSDCMWCANTDCDYFENELTECRREHTRAQCLACKVEHCVHHYDNEEDCFEDNSDECPECERREECQAWLKCCGEDEQTPACGSESAGTADGGSGETTAGLDTGGGR